MNTIVTSREAILKACCSLVMEQGLKALNIRAVAQKCGISIGAVYHYFPSKEALISSAVQEIWRLLFNMGNETPASGSFPEYVGRLFETVQEGMALYPHFFTLHSLAFSETEKEEARDVMARSFVQVKAGMLSVLCEDSRVTPKAFSEAFPREDFVEFVFESLLSLLMTQSGSCSVLTEVIHRVIY